MAEAGEVRGDTNSLLIKIIRLLALIIQSIEEEKTEEEKTNE